MSSTRGVKPGAAVSGEGAIVPPGAVDGRGGVVTPFHGHIVSPSLCPIRGGMSPTVENVRGSTAENLPFTHCHLAHSRSTFACRRKNKGSFAAVGICEIEPVKLTCAV